MEYPALLERWGTLRIQKHLTKSRGKGKHKLLAPQATQKAGDIPNDQGTMHAVKPSQHGQNGKATCDRRSQKTKKKQNSAATRAIPT